MRSGTPHAPASAAPPAVKHCQIAIPRGRTGRTELPGIFDIRLARDSMCIAVRLQRNRDRQRRSARLQLMFWFTPQPALASIS